MYRLYRIQELTVKKFSVQTLFSKLQPKHIKGIVRVINLPNLHDLNNMIVPKKFGNSHCHTPKIYSHYQHGITRPITAWFLGWSYNHCTIHRRMNLLTCIRSTWIRFVQFVFKDRRLCCSSAESTNLLKVDRLC